MTQSPQATPTKRKLATPSPSRSSTIQTEKRVKLTEVSPKKSAFKKARVEDDDDQPQTDTGDCTVERQSPASAGVEFGMVSRNTAKQFRFG